MKNYKKIISIILIIVFFVALAPPVYVFGGYVGDSSGNRNVILRGNNLIIQSNAVAATSGIRYKTVAYKARVIIDSTTYWVRVDYTNFQSDSIDTYTIPFTKDESVDKSIMNMLIDKYPSAADTIKNYWKGGGRIYLDPVMIVTVNGVSQGVEYDTLEGIRNATYNYNGTAYRVPWATVTYNEFPSHFGYLDFESQQEYMDIKNPAINVNFDLYTTVQEFQSTGFKDNTKATDTEIQNWKAIVTKEGAGSGTVYNDPVQAETDLAKGLPEGKYNVWVYADDKENDSDTDYVFDQQTKTITVIKPDPLIATAVETVPSRAEIDTPFTVTAENSMPSKGGKIIDYQHQVSIGNPSNFVDIPESDGGKQESFEYATSTEQTLYFRVWIKDTNGCEAWSLPVSINTEDNTPVYTNAQINSPYIYYEGLFNHVLNRSTFTRNDETYSASSDEGRAIGHNSWHFYDLDNVDTGAYAKFEKKDWKSYAGGKLRFFVPGHDQLHLKTSTNSSSSIDTKTVEVVSLPKAIGEIEGNKKNREVYIYNKSFFKPRDAWQSGENGEIDNSKTKITITNLETGQVATSTGGSAFNSSFVKGVSTEFGEVYESDYTHIKNDVTKIIFVGDDARDQKTERFKIQIQVTDKRGNTDTWEEVRTIEGDKKPISKLKGILQYIRSPLDKKAHTDIEVHSFSPDLDKFENKVTLDGSLLPVIGDRNKLDFTPDKTGEYILKVNVIERFISDIISALKGFLFPHDEKQDNKDYIVKVDNIAPTASFSAIKPSYVNMQTFINNNDISNFDNEMNTFISNMQNEQDYNITINNIQSSFINEEGWFNVTDQMKAPSDMIVEVNSAKGQGKSTGFKAYLLNDSPFTNYFVASNAIETSSYSGGRYSQIVTYNLKSRIYDLKTKTMIKEVIEEKTSVVSKKYQGAPIYSYVYVPVTTLDCTMSTSYYNDLIINPYYVPTIEKINKIDTDNIDSYTYDVYTNGKISYEDGEKAYYTRISADGKVRFKQYNKATNTVTTLFESANEFRNYIPSIVKIDGPWGKEDYILNKSYIKGTIIKDQYLFASVSRYDRNDRRRYIFHITQFDENGNYVRTAKIGGNDETDLRDDFYSFISGGISNTPYLLARIESYGRDSHMASYNVDTGEVKYIYTDHDSFHISDKYMGIHSEQNRFIHIVDTNLNTIFIDYVSSSIFEASKQIPLHMRHLPEYNHYAFISNNDTSTFYAVDLETGMKKELLGVGGWSNNNTTVIGDYYYYTSVENNKPVLKKVNYKTGGTAEVVNPYLYNYTDFPLNPTGENGNTAIAVTPNENSFRDIKEYWIVEPVRKTGVYKVQYAERIIDSLEKLNNYPSNSAQANILPIITSKALKLSDIELTKIIQKINKINTARAFSNKIKIVFLDIGGQNTLSGQELATSTEGVYYNCTTPTDARTKLGNYIKSLVTTQKGIGTIHIKAGDILSLTGNSIDYEGDPIALEQYRSQGKSWGTFATGIQNLGNNKLKFTQQGTFVLEYRTKDSPPTVNIDTSKYSNIAQLTVIVGDGSTIDPPTPLPPQLTLTIKGSKADGSIVERHRVDFILNTFEGSNPIDWSTLNIQFNQTDYLPYTKPTTTAFSRIFKNTGSHSVTVTLKDTAGLSVTQTFNFSVVADQLPNATFTLIENGRRDESGVAEFTIDATISSTDDEIGSVEYFLKAPKYTVDASGNVVQDGTMYYPIPITNNTINLEEVGTTEIKQVVTEYYENGISLDGYDLDANGYRVFQARSTFRYPTVVNIAPTLNYSVSPQTILKGTSVSHIIDVQDDTALGDTVKYKFTHNANYYQNSDGVNSKNNTVTDTPTTKLDEKGLYTFYAQAQDEDGAYSSWVNGGQVKVVSKPVADFELFSDPTKNGGENLEYGEDFFKTGSKITLKNLSVNEDYGVTRQNHGIAYAKVEYKMLGDTDYTTVYERDNLIDYPLNIDLPVVADRAKYQVRLTIRSVDGIEDVKVKEYTTLELRIDSALEPSTIYASQPYKVKATLSKDSIGAVAKDHNGNWVTLNKISEDSTNIYYEKEISTLDTLLDGSYPIEVYGEYPFGNELREDLTLVVNTPIELNSDLIPLGPSKYISYIQDNNGDNDFIKIPASERILVQAAVTTPIPVNYVKAQLEGEGDTNLIYNSTTGKYEAEIFIPSNKSDGDYNLSVTVEVANNNTANNNHTVRISTPADLTGYINTYDSNALVFLDDNNTLTASTSKYVDSVIVDILGSSILLYEQSNDGTMKTWSNTIFVDQAVGELNDAATFTAKTCNNKTSTDTVDFTTILPLEITGRVESTPVWAGYWVTIIAETNGYAEDVTATIKGNTYHMTALYPTTNKENTWEMKYQTYKFEPDGAISVELKAFRGIKDVSTTVNIVIQDSYLEHRKAAVKQ